MSALRATLFLTAVLSASPAPAAIGVTLGDALLSRPLAGEAGASLTATQHYFDADALLTLGAVALAGGALAAAGRRARSVAPAPVRVRIASPVLHPRDAA